MNSARKAFHSKFIGMRTIACLARIFPLQTLQRGTFLHRICTGELLIHAWIRGEICRKKKIYGYTADFSVQTNPLCEEPLREAPFYNTNQPSLCIKQFSHKMNSTQLQHAGNEKVYKWPLMC